MTSENASKTNITGASQYVADNADHNLLTLDGTGTFHGLGVIRWGPKSEYQTAKIARSARRKLVGEICADTGIEIVQYSHASKALANLNFSPMNELIHPFVIPEDVFYSNVLWKASWVLKDTTTPHWTNWTGYMETLFKSTRQSSSDIDAIEILPMIDLDPNDETTLYSAIRFIHDEVLRTGPGVTTLTFDQPLYLKAMEIVLSKDLISIVLPRLGGFHTLMSAVGSIFDTMRGSGCSEACEQIYATNSVPNILSGHAIARALRCLHLLDAALHVKLLQQIIA